MEEHMEITKCQGIYFQNFQHTHQIFNIDFYVKISSKQETLNGEKNAWKEQTI